MKNIEAQQSLPRIGTPSEGRANQGPETLNLTDILPAVDAACNPKPSLLEDALAWARAGWRVFPLKPGEKTPLTEHGFKDATTDAVTIAGWWTKWPDANIGICTGNGLVVLDVDTKDGKDGWKALAAVGITRELLDGLKTYTVTTPTRGSHYWFSSDEPVRGGRDVLGPGSGVDVRGEGGYIVAPPSVRPEGAYLVASCGDGCDAGNHLPRLSKLANWSALGGKIHRPIPPPPPPKPSVPISDSEMRRRMDRAKAYLAKCEGAISGQGGHDRTFSVASSAVNGFLIPPEVALALLVENYNPRCQPPWSAGELEHKVNSALEKGPPDGKPYGWLLNEDGGSDLSADGDIPVVEVPEQDDDEDAENSPTVEPIESVPFPDGIVGDTARWIYERSSKPFRPFAIASALSVWATLAGRKARYQNQGATFYGLFVTATSNGKDAPLMLPREILTQIGVPQQHIIGRITSWNAAHEKMSACWIHPVILSLIDEGAGYFSGLRSSDYGALDFFKAAWSRSESSIDPQGRVKKSGSLNLRAIHRPAWSMLMGAQPKTLGRAVGTEQLEDGLLPRMLWLVRDTFVVDLASENLDRSTELKDSELGERILARGQKLWGWLDKGGVRYHSLSGLDADFFKQDADNDYVFEEVWQKPHPFTVSPQADEVFRAFIQRTQKRVKPAAEGRASPLGFLWGKAAENSKRIALILAAARCGGEKSASYVIDEAEARWATRFVEASVWSGIKWAGKNMADTPFQRNVNDVLGLIEGAPGKTINHGHLHRKLRYHLTVREVDDVLASLIAGGEIEVVTVHTKGRSAKGYRIRARNKQRR